MNKVFDELCRVTDNSKVGPAVHRMDLESPNIASNAQPGQFVMVRLGSGQDVPFLRRPFSLHRIGSDGRISLLYRIVGWGTEIMGELNNGDCLQVLGPLGRGFDLEAASDSAYIAAGGMGVAPMLALAEALAGKTALKIFYGVKIGSEGIDVFSKLLEDHTKVELNKISESGDLDHEGMVTDHLEIALASQKKPIFACGPRPMLKTIAQLAQSAGVCAQVSMEERMACGLGACLGCVTEKAEKHQTPGSLYTRVCKEGPVFNVEDVKW